MPLHDWSPELAQIRQWQHQQQNIVFTNGCFDILHPGHIQYLNAAKQLGHRLVVGINDDASITRLKGALRPIHTLHDRICMLSALRAVDLVIPFEQDTPLELILAIKPNTLVKGSDYAINEIVGAREVIEHGGKVQTIDFKDGYSSSGILQKIRQA